MRSTRNYPTRYRCPTGEARTRHPWVVTAAPGVSPANGGRTTVSEHRGDSHFPPADAGNSHRWAKTCGFAWFIAISALLLGPAIAVGQQVYFSGSNVTGALNLSRVVNLRQQAQPALFAPSRMAGPEILRTPTPRLLPPAPGSPAKSNARLQAAVQPNELATPAATLNAALILTPPTGTSGFNALSHRDQRLASNGNQFSIEPPNQSVAVGNGYVLEGVNNAIQIYTTSGAPALPSVLASNQVFGLGPAINWISNTYGVYLTDMRVYFDQTIGRWFIVQRSQDNDLSGNYLASSHLYVAVSQTSDPTAAYNIYIMDTTNSGHPGCPCIADYPQIGSDQYGFHIAWNEFSYNAFFGAYTFVDAAILTVSKASLAGGASSPTAFQFLLPYASGFEFAIQPAATPPGASNFLASGGLEYFVSSFVYGSGSQVAVWAMYNTSSLATLNPGPILTRITVPTLAYTIPNVATQRSGPTPYGSSLIPPAGLETLDGGDSRVQALVYASGRLFLTLQTQSTDDTGRPVVGAAYIVLSPTFRSGALAAQVINQGYLVVNGNHLLRPAIGVNAQGNGAIGVTLVGPDWYPTVAAIPFQTFAVPATIQVVAKGALPEDGFSGYSTGGGSGVARWGDYNAAVTATDGSIWMVVQYIADAPRTEVANWNTWVFRKQP